MKNDRLVRAYDTVSPTEEQKQRMLDSILQEANFQEKPEKPAKERKPVLYAESPSKPRKKSPIPAIAASLLLLAVSAGVLLQMLKQPEIPAYIAPTETTAPTERTPELVLPVDPTPYGMYNAIIADYVGYLNGTLSNPTGIPKKLLEVIDSRDTSGLGWIVYDVDGDGIEEMLISDGELIYQALTMDEEAMELPILFTSMQEEQYYRCQDGVFCKVSDYGGDYVQYDFFKVDMNRLDLNFRNLQEVVICDHGEYRIGKTEEEAVPVDESTAQWTLGEKYLRERLFVTPFQEEKKTKEPAQNLTGFAPYDEIIQRYARAVDQGWPFNMLEINDMSTMIAEDNAYLELGWCTLDIDNNGQEELLISTTDRLYDLYTISPDGIRQVVVSKAGNRHALCQNGYLALTQIQGDDLPWFKSYFKYDSGQLTEEEGVSYLEVESPSGNYWQYYRGASSSSQLRQPISKDEAGQIMSNYIEQELFVTRFMPRDPDAYDTDGTYAETLQLYHKAMYENWNPAQCMEAGISMSFANYSDSNFTVGYAFRNLDGGEEELLITDGRNIYGLYTVLDGEVTSLFTGEARINYTLTADNRIFCRGAGGAALTYYTLYRLVNPFVAEEQGLKESGLVVEEAYIFDAMTDPDHPWFYSSDGVNLGQPCGSFDAEARTEALADDWQQIDFIPF